MDRYESVSDLFVNGKERDCFLRPQAEERGGRPQRSNSRVGEACKSFSLIPVHPDGLASVSRDSPAKETATERKRIWGDGGRKTPDPTHQSEKEMDRQLTRE